MAFIQDPRVRQRWNQISQNAEAVTENAAAGIWTFQHRYITPCLSGIGNAFDSCAGLCIGDREERARRARERDRGARRTRAEYSFDFYDDWEEAEEEALGGGGGGSGSGILGGWTAPRGEDWDRLLAGTGGRSRRAANSAVDVVDQPRRKRGMSYGTRGVPRRKASAVEEDPNVIPRTAPLGFLGRLPFKIGGTLRYKPSAANLRDHPGAPVSGEHGEDEPLLGTSDEEEPRKRSPQSRPRSNTAGSGETSSSYRSRGDLFPSDGEGEEDAVPLDDEFAVALDRVDDRGSTKTRSSKGKRPDREISRTVSRSTIDSAHSANGQATFSFPALESGRSLEDLQREEEAAEREEHEEIERRRRAASQLAAQRGLSSDGSGEPKMGVAIQESKRDEDVVEPPPPTQEVGPETEDKPALAVAGEDLVPPSSQQEAREAKTRISDESESGFVPARLPHFG
ncbi:hypothetical protein QBC47DRAFT_367773 [Echria macrotheca]|uniref:Uncharacterized protein n=1 Tax=Echria macrotheca TaxID=438768 RepID=A0AAJ0FES9_9PEZI|nr:hypothetical protein QBC47DRAFT_367773 [Echria macrotheca]